MRIRHISLFFLFILIEVGTGICQITWRVDVPSPLVSGRSAIAWVGKYIYLFGGDSINTLALAYDFENSQWVQSTSYPNGFENGTAAAAGGKIYVLGASRGSPPTLTREFFEFTPDGTGRGIWVRKKDYPFNVTLIGLASLGDTIVIAAGGYLGGVRGTPQCYKYSIVQDTWTPIASLPKSRFAAGLVSFGGKLYLLGGLDTLPGFYMNTCFEYDLVLNLWTSKANMLQGIAFNHSCVTTDGMRIYSVGGGGGLNPQFPATDAVQSYEPVSNTWRLENPLPQAYGVNSAIYAAYFRSPFIFSTGGLDTTSFLWVNKSFKGSLPYGVEESEKLKVESEKLSFEVFPNPATSVANLRLQISDSRLKSFNLQSSNLSIFQSSISIKIYDVTGRLVREIPLTLKTDTDFMWNLSDDAGKRVSAGVYFVRLEIASSPDGHQGTRNDKSEEKTQIKRVVVLR